MPTAARKAEAVWRVGFRLPGTVACYKSGLLTWPEAEARYNGLNRMGISAWLRKEE